MLGTGLPGQLCILQRYDRTPSAADAIDDDINSKRIRFVAFNVAAALIK